MIINRKITIAFIGLNILGIVSSLLYGMFGGSGGETTEGVYLGLFYTNLISTLFGIIVVIAKFSWWRSNFIWAILVLLIYYPVTSVVVINKINNVKNSELKSTEFGVVPPQIYMADKNQVTSYLKKQNKENSSVDTLLYSKSLSKVLIICSYQDSSGLYKNFELFAVNNGGLLIHFPKGGNLVSEGLNKQNLLKQVFKWYVNAYSTDEEEKSGLWNYPDFW